ncbi:MAG: protein kinase, partial [Candidatus Wallbacteria bacterium]|nr:protein kinase [Candidatus Wallbacteria bacterium]
MIKIGLKPGMMLSGCRVESQIGEGGMGAVYRAFDENLERTVAIKLLQGENSEDRERFKREAKTLAQCRHPGIVQIYSSGQYEDCPYYVMEYVEGRSLDVFLKRARLIMNAGDGAAELVAGGYVDPGKPDMPYFMRDPVTDPRHDKEY